MTFSITTANNTLANAIARGEESWLVTIEGWCETSTAYPDYPGSILPAGCFPQYTSEALSHTFAGIAIGPRSDVDRAWVTYNAGPVFPVNAPVDNDYVASIRRLSVDAPLLYQQSASKPGQTLSSIPVALGGGYPNVALAMQFGLMYVFPTGVDPGGHTGFRVESTLLPARYRLDTESVMSGGTEELTPLISPRMQLQFFLRPGAPMTATKRFPFQYQEVATQIGAAGTETRLVVAPIYGRKKVVVQAACDKAAAWRISTIRANYTPLYFPFEVTQGNRTGIAAEQSIYFELCDPCADLMILYVTPGAVNSSSSFTITAYD